MYICTKHKYVWHIGYAIAHPPYILQCLQIKLVCYIAHTPLWASVARFHNWFLGHGDVAILNPHMWCHEHTIFQTTQTERKIKR